MKHSTVVETDPGNEQNLAGVSLFHSERRLRAAVGHERVIQTWGFHNQLLSRQRLLNRITWAGDTPKETRAKK